MAPGSHSERPTRTLTSGLNKAGPRMAVKRTMAPNHTAALSKPINLSIGATAADFREIGYSDKQRPAGANELRLEGYSSLVKIAWRVLRSWRVVKAWKVSSGVRWRR